MVLIRDNVDGGEEIEFSELSTKELSRYRHTPEALIEFIKRDLKDESRAARLSNVERSIIKDSDQCVLCNANNDPNKVPVHPNCHCDVVTESVETGTVEPGHRLLDVLSGATENLEIQGIDVLEGASVQLVPESVAVFDPETVRWADFTRWLESVEPLLNQADVYLSIVVDDDTGEAAQQVEEVVGLLVEDVEAGIEALKDKKLWFAIAKTVI